MHQVNKFRILENYYVELWFKNGERGKIDLKPFLGKGIASELLEEKHFQTLHIEEGGGLAFMNGYDFCPNFLYQKMEVVDVVEVE